MVFNFWGIDNFCIEIYHCNFLFDVTNVSTHKVYFRQLPANSNVYTVGNTNRNFTYMTFMRIGDT